MENSKNTSKKLVLFDIDGTISLSKGPSEHWNAFIYAFDKILKINVQASEGKQYNGCTDLQIVYIYMEKNGHPKDEKLAKSILNEIANYYHKIEIQNLTLIPHVKPAVEALSKQKNVILGLVTGNLIEIADKKLSHLGINHHFKLGGFGGSSDVRAHLIDIAIKDAEKIHGCKISKNDVFIIGDTLRDIAAAKQAGVKVIAVATGYNSKDELHEGKPDFLFDNLSDTKKLIDAINTM